MSEYENDKKLEWEYLLSIGGGTESESLTRLKVENGYIYKFVKREPRHGNDPSKLVASICFVPYKHLAELGEKE